MLFRKRGAEMSDQNQAETPRSNPITGRSHRNVFLGTLCKKEGQMRSRLKTIALTAAFLLIGSGRLFAADMGLTPSHVVGLWTNVNNCLIVAAQIAGKNQALVETVRNIMPRSFKGKNPPTCSKTSPNFVKSSIG